MVIKFNAKFALTISFYLLKRVNVKVKFLLIKSKYCIAKPSDWIAQLIVTTSISVLDVKKDFICKTSVNLAS
jgi:hypothetical protein